MVTHAQEIYVRPNQSHVLEKTIFDILSLQKISPNACLPGSFPGIKSSHYVIPDIKP